MNCSTRFALAAAASLALFGCRDNTVTPPVGGPAFAVSDGAHNGNPDFFFLPPMFKNPNTNPNFEPAAFNPNLRPAVEICLLGPPALDGTRDCVGAPITRFAPSEISVSLTDQQYQVNWRTDLSNLNVAMFYRIQVLVGTRVLGFADVDPVVNLTGKQLQNLQTGEFIPLVDGRTLPIKFRIETGVLCATDGTPCTSSTVNLNTGGTIELLGAGEDFKLDIRPGTVATFGGQPVTDVTFNLEVCTGIDVDLPTFGPCLRVGTYFNTTGTTGPLEFAKPLLLSMCVLNSVYHTLDETRQEGLITLHQQDGTLIRALPHAVPNCGTIGTRARGWSWLRELAARLLAPQAAYAATRSALLHVGAGGETTALAPSCPPPPSSPRAAVPGLFLETTCPPSSPAIGQSEGTPQRIVTALISPPRTVSDFQFALPAKMDYVNPLDANRTAAPGTVLPTAVQVTDWDGANVAGARVTFLDPAGAVIGTAISDAQGVALIAWVISAGTNTAIATGRGIAAQNNYPGGTVKPFMPDISLPTNQQSPVALGTGKVRFTVSGGLPDLVIDNILVGPVDLTFADYVTYDVTVRNQGTAAAPASIALVDGPSSIDGRDVGADVLNVPPLAVGASVTLRSRLGPRAPGGATVTATADQTNLIVESNEANNSFTTQFSVAPKITFETLGNGTPISQIALPLALVNDYSLQGLAFSYVQFDQTPGVASLCNSRMADPVDVTTNHAATLQASGDPCSGFTQGQLTLTFDPGTGLPTTVVFQLRGPDNIGPFPITGVDAAGTLLGVLKSNAFTYTSNNGFLARQETATVSSAGGITQIFLNLPAGTGVAFIDDLVIIR